MIQKSELTTEFVIWTLEMSGTDPSEHHSLVVVGLSVIIESARRNESVGVILLVIFNWDEGHFLFLSKHGESLVMGLEALHHQLLLLHLPFIALSIGKHS